jgi:hypothetical protein
MFIFLKKVKKSSAHVQIALVWFYSPSKIHTSCDTVPLRLFHCSSFVSVASDALHNKLQVCSYICSWSLSEWDCWLGGYYLKSLRPVRGILLLSQNYRARMSDIRLSAGGQGGQTWDSCSSQQCTHDLLFILYHMWTIGMGRGKRESKRAQNRSSFNSCIKGLLVYVQ